MSRRSSKSQAPRSNQPDSQVVTVAHQDAEATPEPSLEALLASCGALQSALKHSENSDGCVGEVVTIDKPTAKPSMVEIQSAEFNLRPEFSEGSNESTSESPEWVNSLRQEFRTSIDEIKAAQEAASASQSAVLKTLTEIIFQSSTGRSGSDAGLDQKFAEFEDRILNRISQAGNLTVAADAKRPTSRANSDDSVGKSARTWAEIRNDLVIRVERPEFDGELDEIAALVLDSGSACDSSDSSQSECILEVPAIIDPETLTDQELRKVFHEREEFIVKLIGRLRYQYQKSSGHLPAEQLERMAEYLPQELAAQVLQTLQQLDELARIGEMELSLERARLARELNQLDHSRQQIEYNARQLGLKIAEDGTLSNPQQLTRRNSSSRRWLSKLGFGL